LHVQLNGNDWHVMVINTLPQAREGLQAVVRTYDMDGTQRSQKTLPLSAKPCAATDLGAAEWPEGLSPVHYLKLELKDARGKVISDNFYWRTTATVAPGAAPQAADNFGAGGVGSGGPRGGAGAGRGAATGPAEDFALLQALPTAEVQVTPKRHDAAGKCLIDVTIANPTKLPALQVHVQLRKQRTGERVLPVFYSENFISLLPGESKMLTVEAASSSLGNETPEIAVDGWNVTAVAQNLPGGGGVAVALNKEAFVGPKAVVPATAPLQPPAGN
jgi:hypothetical protein